jgi:hypothetical protein
MEAKGKVFLDRWISIVISLDCIQNKAVLTAIYLVTHSGFKAETFVPWILLFYFLKIYGPEED